MNVAEHENIKVVINKRFKSKKILSLFQPSSLHYYCILDPVKKMEQEPWRLFAEKNSLALKTTKLNPFPNL